MFSTLLIIATLLTGSANTDIERSVTVTERPTETELQLALRDLWTGHVFWVRSVVVATHYEDEAGAAAAEEQVVRNARSLADAVIPFYGEEAADKLFELLAGHYGAIKEYMKADFAGNTRGAKKASDSIVSNAEEISVFLSGANPYLPKDTLMSLLSAHGGHHIAQIGAIDKGDFKSEAGTWEAMLKHMYTISDAMASALTRQFPDIVKAE